MTVNKKWLLVAVTSLLSLAAIALSFSSVYARAQSSSGGALTITVLPATTATRQSNILAATVTVTAVTTTTTNPSGGGGGGGGGSASVGITHLVDFTTDKGKFVVDATAASDDQLVELSIDKGTIALNKNGQRLMSITIRKMQNPPPPPEDAHIIGLAYTFEPSGATFDPPITVTFTYYPSDLPEGFNEEDLAIAFYDTSSGEWVVLSNIAVDTVAHTVSGDLSHFTDFAVVAYPPPPVTTTPPAITTSTTTTPTVTMPTTTTTPAPPETPAPASFSVADLSVTPPEVAPLGDVTVTAVIQNTGGSAGSYPVVLKVNGEQEDSREVSVSPGEKATLTFTLAKKLEGVYTVDVNGKTGQFTVVVPQPVLTEPIGSIPTKQPFPWWIIGLAIIVLIVVVFVYLEFGRKA
jgi:hypothetical protein